MRRTINFYARYQRQNQRVRSLSHHKLVILAPLFLAFLLMAGFCADILIENAEKSRQLDQINAEIDSIQSSFDEAQKIADHATALSALYTGLQSSEIMFALYPDLDQNLFLTVKRCAGEAFSIEEYKYEEAATTLAVYAHAPSVNEMPRFVEALRNTGLFSAVTYTGYTSDSNGDYYCTVGCTLNSVIGG